MVEIIRNSDGTFSMISNGRMLPTSFLKIEKVNDDSNFYCLWFDNEKFYLYNSVIGKYVFNSFTHKDAKTFSKVCYYSINSKSFVAYRRDNNLAYIIFENGEYEKYPFKYVGEELYGTRAVKGQNDRWVYYNTLTRRVLVSIKKGLQLKDEEKLVKLYNHDYYIVCKDDLYYKILYYDFKKHKSLNLRDKIEYFEESCNGNIIGKLYGKKIYFLFSSKNPIKTIRYYTTKPKYNSERNIYIAKKGDSYAIINKRRDVSNYQWVTDDFIFYKEYVLNSNDTGKYKIYCIDTGYELYPNYRNIKYNSKEDCLIVDTECEIGKKIYDTDLYELKSLFLNELKTSKKQNKVTCSKRNIINKVNSNDSIDECSENGSQLENGKIDRVVFPIKEESKCALPNSIDFMIFIDKIELTNNGYLQCNRKTYKDLFTGCHICWIIKEKSAIAITKQTHVKTYKCLYYRENVDLGIFKNDIGQNYFYKFSVNIVDEATLFQEIEHWEYYIDEDKTETKEEICEEPDGDTNVYNGLESENNINRYDTLTLLHKLKQRGENLRKEKELESREYVENREKNNDEIKPEYTLPDYINYIVFVDKVKFVSKKFLICPEKKLNADSILSKGYLCWLIKNRNSIAITEFIFGTHKLLYYIENVNLEIYKKDFEINKLFKCSINLHGGEKSLFKELEGLEYSNTEIETKIDAFEKDTVRIKTTCIDKRVFPQICKKNEIKQAFPNKINFIAFVYKINIPDRGDFIQYRVIDDIRVGECVCWIVKENNSIAITKLIFGMTHKILYYKENISIDIFKNNVNVGYKEFYKCFLNIPNKKEDELFKELKAWESMHIRDLKKDIKCDCSNEINTSEQVVFNNSVHNSKSDISGNKIKITYEGNDYILGVNDVWNEEIFYRRRFVLKNNLIAILLDNTVEIKEENNKIIYEIIGEGKDKRFNQDFISPANRTIKENSKQIILFKRDVNGILHFVDNVVCEGYYEVDDEKDKRDKKRKIIIFILRSLMRTDTKLQSTTNN